LGVQATLQQRLDQLTPDERDACRHLAVLGRSCRWEELHAFAPTTATPVVDSLVRKGILRDSDIDGAPAVELSGSLLQQVAYDTITPEARARLHSEAARTLEALPGISAHEIALHFDRAGEPSAAVEHYVRATRDALKWGDADTALRCADRALDLGAAGPLRLELHLARAEAFQFTGHREAQRQALDEAFPLAQRAADRARVLTEQASWLARAGDFQQAIAVAQKALDAARSSESPRAIALASGRWALSLVFAGRAEEGESLVREASRAAREHGDPLLMAEAAEWRALQAASVGDLGEARRAFEAAVELFRDGGDRRRAAVNENNLADMHNRVGSYAEAERSLAEAIAYFQHSANRPSEAYAQLNRAYSQLARGAVDEALLSLGRSEELAAELRDARLDVALRLYRAKALLAQGDWGLAASLAARAAAEAERAGQAGLWVNAMTVEAWARLRSHDPAAAADKARAALERRDELGGVEEDEADVFLAYASALEALGRTEEAATVRERGRSRLRYVAARIRNAELRRCLLEDVPSHAALLAGPTVR
jgi:tetratricopeptide (TPR) repeat protein